MAASDRHAALWVLLTLTGLRPEEALGLKWEDIDGTTLRVQRALVRAGEGWHLEPTKTRQSRSVPLADMAAKALTSHRARQSQVRLQLGAEYVSRGFIFATDTGEPLHWGNVTRRHFRPMLARLARRLLGEPEVPPSVPKRERRAALEAWKVSNRIVLTRAGLVGFRPYDLRHTAASLLLAAGEHPKVVSELLGHSRIALTLDTYSSVAPNLVERATDRLAEIIKESRGTLRLG